MDNWFYAYLSRLKLIKRWSLMRNIVEENVAEHSLQVAIVAHALAVIGRKYFNDDIDEREVIMRALYHDVGEVIIGDLPTPVKYFNPEIKTSYSEIENVAKQKLLTMLPEQLKDEYQPLFFPPSDKVQRIVKAADKITAYIKCLEEGVAGNREFALAEQSILAEINKYSDLPQVGWFMENCIAGFTKTIDEMG